MNKSNVVARLTIVRADESRLIIEVNSDSTFSEFFFYYKQVGMKRSTKVLAFTRNRNQGLKYINAHMQTPGLEVLAESFTASNKAFYGRDGQALGRNPITSMKLRIIKKREYRKLLNAAPTGMPVAMPIFKVRNPSVGILLLLPTRRVNAQAGG